MNFLKNIKWLAVIFAIFVFLILSSFLWIKDNTALCRMSINLYEESSPREMSPLDKLEAGQKIRVKEKHFPWVLVQAGSFEGWLPEWYLTKNAKDLLPEIVPYLMVVKEETPLYLYPDYHIHRYYPSNELENLEAGVLVKVENEFNNWSYVQFIVHGVPRVQRGCVKSESLATSQEATPLQGKILAGTRIFLGDSTEENITSLPMEICDHNVSINIYLEKGDMFYVFAAGGWSFWVNKKDIIFDPFFN